MRTVVGALSLVFLVIAVVASVVLGIAGYQIQRDIDSHLALARVEGQAESMLVDLTNAQAGLDAWNMREGYSAIIFKTPDRDMARVRHILVEYTERVQTFVAMDKASDAYQQGMDDLQGRITGLNVHAYDYWLAHDGIFPYTWCWVGWVLFLVFGLWWLFSI